eukprot:scaffold100050_cov72-Phaeocystis_antarctica.AAC.1
MIVACKEGVLLEYVKGARASLGADARWGLLGSANFRSAGKARCRASQSFDRRSVQSSHVTEMADSASSTMRPCSTNSLCGRKRIS